MGVPIPPGVDSDSLRKRQEITQLIVAESILVTTIAVVESTVCIDARIP